MCQSCGDSGRTIELMSVCQDYVERTKMCSRTGEGVLLVQASLAAHITMPIIQAFYWFQLHWLHSNNYRVSSGLGFSGYTNNNVSVIPLYSGSSGPYYTVHREYSLLILGSFNHTISLPLPIGKSCTV